MRTGVKMNKLAVMGALALMAGVVHAGPAAKAAQPTAPAASGKNQQFDDWGYRCETPAGGKESCTILQVASQNAPAGAQGQGAQPQWLLQTAVGFVDGQDKPALIAKARLGIILPPGVVVTVPGHNPIRIPFQRCDATGCIAFVLLDEPFLKALKDGDSAAQKDPNVRATVALTFQANNAQGQSAQQAVALPLSLKGFTKAYAMLKPEAAPAPAAKADDKKGKKDSGKKK